MRMNALEIPGSWTSSSLRRRRFAANSTRGLAWAILPIRPVWLSYQRLQSPLPALVTSVLDAGEAAVIHLAMDEGIGQVCIDELKGRRMALAVGLKVTGALGLLGKAKREGLISELRPYIERALQTGIRYNPDLVRRFLEALGE